MTRASLTVLGCLLAACGGSTADPGLDLQMRVRDGQLVRGPLPSDSGGPRVTFIDIRAPRVRPGEGAVRIGGRTVSAAHGVNIAIDREEAYWVMSTGVFDSESPGELSWETLLDFSRQLEAGPFNLQVQATDEQGVPGPVATAPFEALPLYPDGALVVTLEWDANVDADLLVEDPTGVLLGGKNLNTWSPARPGEPLDPPGAHLTGGMLDQDSNANCVIDGLRRENAVWKSFAPAGHYRVLVAMARSCGHPATRYRATVRRSGEIIATAEGVLYESDGRSYPEQQVQGPGVFVTEFDHP